MENIIKLLSEDDILNDFHNIHLREATSAKINIEIYEEICRKKGEKEVVSEKEVIVGVGQNGQPIKSLMKQKAGEMLVFEKNRFEKQSNILKAIEKIRKNG